MSYVLLLGQTNMNKCLEEESECNVKKKTIALVAVSSTITAVLVVALMLFAIHMDNRASYKTDYSHSDNYYSSATNGISSGFGASLDGYADMDFAPALSEAESSMAPTAPGSSSSAVQESVASNRKLIRRASIEAETTEYDEYVTWLDAHVDSLGGYYENKESRVREGGYSNREWRTLYATIRVPTSRLDNFLNDIQSEGNVVYRNETQDDITDSYTDTDAHLNSMRIEQSRLNELLSIAETVDDILAIEDRLSWVRYEIESYERQLRSYDNQIEYSVVTLSVEEVVTYAEPEPEGFFERCWSALQDNLAWLSSFSQDSAVWLFGHLPSIAMGTVVIFAILHTRRQRKAKQSQSTVQSEGEADTKAEE